MFRILYNPRGLYRYMCVYIKNAKFQKVDQIDNAFSSSDRITIHTKIIEAEAAVTKL